MGKLRERMLEDMQLRGLAPKTRKAYLDGVVGLVKFYRVAPEQITEEQIRRYFFHLRDERQAAEGTFSIHFYGIKFLFETTLGRRWPAFGIIRPKRSKKLPVVLSVREVHDVLGRIRQPRTRMCLRMIYSCGLRLSEGTRLQVADVDSGRMLVAVRNGKGGKDRYLKRFIGHTPGDVLGTHYQAVTVADLKREVVDRFLGAYGRKLKSAIETDYCTIASRIAKVEAEAQVVSAAK